MAMIKIENLTFSYPSSYDMIFDHVNIQIDTNWKLGLIGRNGRGKTTLLKLLLGKYEFKGKIISSTQFDYFPYDIANQDRMTEEILQEVCPIAEEWEFMRELSYLEVDTAVLWKPFKTLSLGEQTKVLLAALFLNEDHFLLIDEPTNHLDTKARKIVSSYLQKKKGFILVSHDRCFLDGCVDHILSINRSDIEIQNGNFSSWLENFKQRQDSELAQNDRLKKDINRLQQSAKRSAVWSDRVEATKAGAYDKGYVGHKAAKMMKRSKTIEARQRQAIEQKSALLKNFEKAEKLKIKPLIHYSGTLASLSDITVSYNDNPVCSNISFNIYAGERIALDGKNGCGKSSLLKLLIGEPIEYTGRISISSGLIISYVPQDTSYLSGTLSEFARERQIDESLFKAILHKMDFEQIQFEKDMQNFSGGQKKKVLIAGSLCEQAHLYIWDEPLNFMDIYSRIQIEQLIKEFSPTMIFVEHDSTFRNTIATKTIEL